MSSTIVIRAIAERDQRLLRELEADWNAGRPADSPVKSEVLYDAMPEDQLLYRFAQAARFSATLAAHPDRFAHLLTGSR